MLTVEYGDLAAASSFVGGFTTYLNLGQTELMESGAPWLGVPRQQILDLARAAQTISAIAEKANIRTAQAACADILATIPRHDLNQEPVQFSLEAVQWYLRTLDYLVRSIRDELEGRHAYVLSAHKEAYLAKPEHLFGEAALRAFPSLTYDIGEASRSFAFERWTASVFHSIRCLEAGLQAICRCLGIPDPTTGPERNWSSIQRSIKGKMEAKWPTAANKATVEYMFFERIRGALEAMQNPYRNETMHLSGKYDEDEARHIIEMVGGLLRQIAARCDENGDPKA